ncbi:MAG: hypothetical protein WBG90_21540 [Saonia sp.]
MKRLFALFVFTCLIGYGSTPAVEEGTNPLLETEDKCELTYMLSPEDCNALELMEDLNNLNSEEEVVAFLEKHHDLASKLAEAITNKVFSSGCGSWFNVAGCVQVRQCWAGTTSNGTKYGVYWQTRVTC